MRLGVQRQVVRVLVRSEGRAYLGQAFLRFLLRRIGVERRRWERFVPRCPLGLGKRAKHVPSVGNPFLLKLVRLVGKQSRCRRLQPQGFRQRPRLLLLERKRRQHGPTLVGRRRQPRSSFPCGWVPGACHYGAQWARRKCISRLTYSNRAVHDRGRVGRAGVVGRWAGRAAGGQPDYADRQHDQQRQRQPWRERQYLAILHDFRDPLLTMRAVAQRPSRIPSFRSIDRAFQRR